MEDSLNYEGVGLISIEINKDFISVNINRQNSEFIFESLYFKVYGDQHYDAADYIDPKEKMFTISGKGNFTIKDNDLIALENFELFGLEKFELFDQRD